MKHRTWPPLFLEFLEDRRAPGSLLTVPTLIAGSEMLAADHLSVVPTSMERLSSQVGETWKATEYAAASESVAFARSSIGTVHPSIAPRNQNADSLLAFANRDANGLEGPLADDAFATDQLGRLASLVHAHPIPPRAAPVFSVASSTQGAPVFAPGSGTVAPVNIVALASSQALPATDSFVPSELLSAQAPVNPAPGSGTDPFTLYTHGDSYTPQTGLDRQTYMAQYQANHTNIRDTASGTNTAARAPGSSAIGTPDPGTPGPYDVMTQEYNFGNTAFMPPGFPGNGVELIAEVKAPADLSNGPFPLIVLLHGRHSTTYDPTTNATTLEWPPTGNHLSIPSYIGYDYLADVLASNGYIVASISANGINAVDNSVNDLGALARAQLIERHLDIWRDLSSGDGTVSPFGVAPFGTRFVGEVDLNNVGIMGHSRGGEGVARAYLYNQSLGSPYGIKAVFALAPVDFNRPSINDVPLEVLLPYNDGDVNDLQGAHFYDDSRYNEAGDSAAKGTILVLGANHNFYNTIWTPGDFPAGAGDDGVAGPPMRLTPAQQRGTGLAYMTAFFRANIGGETQFVPQLRGDVAPPPSATISASQIETAYEPADSGSRLDLNRLTNPSALTTNTLGGAVHESGLDTYRVYGDSSVGESNYIFSLEPGAHYPHTVPSARSSHPGLSQLVVAYSGSNASYENDVPAADEDVSGFYALQFRVGVIYSDAHNPSGQNQDFSVILRDNEGDSFSTTASTWSNALYDPVGGNPLSTPTPHLVLNTVRIPLTAFAWGGVDLTQVAQVEFDFDQRSSGAYSFDDLAFADPANLYAGPHVVSSSPTGIQSGPISNVQVHFNAPIDPNSFTPDQISVTDPQGSAVPATDIEPLPNSANSTFVVSFAPQGLIGYYNVVVGPSIQDVAGNPMDQNLNGVGGENPQDTYSFTFAVPGARVIASSPTGNVAGPVSTIEFTFNEPMNPDTFSPDQVHRFTGPGGVNIVVTDVMPVDGSNDTQFDVDFAPQTALGVYIMIIGPEILDTYGDEMDQNGNLIPGEIPGDQYATSFRITS